VGSARNLLWIKPLELGLDGTRKPCQFLAVGTKLIEELGCLWSAWDLLGPSILAVRHATTILPNDRASHHLARILIGWCWQRRWCWVIMSPWCGKNHGEGAHIEMCCSGIDSLSLDRGCNIHVRCRRPGCSFEALLVIRDLDSGPGHFARDPLQVELEHHVPAFTARFLPPLCDIVQPVIHVLVHAHVRLFFAFRDGHDSSHHPHWDLPFAVEHEGCVALGQRLVLRVLARDSLPAHACVHDRVSVVFHLVPARHGQREGASASSWVVDSPKVVTVHPNQHSL